MHPEKKITKEDTWKSDDLRRHIRGGEHEEDDGRRRDDYERKHSSGESVERRHRYPEKEAMRERDKYRERDSTRERAKANDAERDRPKGKKKDGSRNRTGEREERDKERRREMDRVVDDSEYRDGKRGSKDRRHDREENENRVREKARERDKKRDRTRDREKDEHRDRDKDNGRDEKDRDRIRDEKDRERRAERDRRRDEERGTGGRDRERQSDREKRDRHKERDNLKESERFKDGSQDKQKDKERRERHMVQEHSEQKEEREYREQRRKEKEEREGRHKERAQHDTVERRRHDGESRELDRERAHMERKGLEGRIHGDRERAERDKHRERNHREPGNPERDPRTSTKRTSSDHSHREKTEHSKTKEVVMRSESVWRSSQRVFGDTEEPVEHEEVQAEDQGFDDAQECYEEDFEDYEEDFEDVDESDCEDEKQPHSHEDREELTPQRRKDIEAIQRAMDEENEKVGSAQPRLNTEEEERPKRTRGSEMPQSKGLQYGKFIDFVAAKQREVSRKVASKQKKRSTELLRLMDLDFSTTFSLLDLPPVSEYDMYIKSFGTTNTKQAYVQCNEDNTDRDIQTEELELSEKWTQHPAERNIACGGPNLSHEASDESITNMNIDSQRLAKFLHSASQVVAVLLEEDSAENQSLKKLRSQADTLSFSDGCLQLNTKLPFLHDRQISLVHFSQVQRQTMLSVHSPSTKPSAVRLDSKTVICIWNIWEPSRPQKILVYESEVHCCCFSPGKATLVFAGTAIGSVVLWDLREHSSAHYTLRIGENEWTLRHPTFSTDAILAASGHMCSVNSVEAVPSAVAEGTRPERPLLVSEEESSGLSFQLASLDENGVLNLWVVVQLPKANDAGSQTDLGLRPGGKVKLLHSATLFTSERSSPRDTTKTGQLQTLLLKFLPSNCNHFFVGTNMGLVNHGTSHGLKSPPKFYRPQVVGLRPVDVTSLNFSPFGEPVFLVGCGDGSVRLHTVMSEQPVMEWTNSTAGEPVVSVQWAQTRPTVFCVLDAASNLHIWDLLERDFEPVLTIKIDADIVTAMAVFGDPAKQNTFSGVALARQSGKIEMQYFTKRFRVPDSQDLGKLQSMMDEAP